MNSKWIPQRLRIILLREAINSTYSKNFINLRGGLDQYSTKSSLLQVISESKLKLAKLDQFFVSRQGFITRNPDSKVIALISNTSDFTKPLQEFVSREPGRELTVLDLGQIKQSDSKRVFSRALLNARSLEPELFQLLESEGWDKTLRMSDTWFVDWCLDNAVIFSNLKPAGKKLIIRIHRFDAFSWYGHLVDWSQVDGLVFVSRTIQSIFLRFMGRKLNGFHGC